MLRKKMKGFARLVFWVFVVGIVVSIIGIMATLPKKAHAERQFSKKDGTTLSVFVKTMDIPGIPEEINRAENFETIFRLYTGQIKSATIKNQVEKRHYISFPWIKEQVLYKENTIMCLEGRWFVDPSLLRPVERNDYSLSFGIWGVVVILMIIGIVLVVVSVRALKESGGKLTACIMPDRNEQVDRG